MKKAQTTKAPIIPGLSQAIIANGIVFLSGQTGTDPETAKLVGEGVGEQTKQCLKNIAAVLEESGCSKNDVVKVVVYLSDMSEMKGFNEVYKDFFGDHYPARAAVAVAGMAKNAKVELDVMAVLPTK